MDFRVVARLDHRSRTFHVQALTSDEAQCLATHLIRSVYQNTSGTLGNVVWREGNVTMTSAANEVVALGVVPPEPGLS